MFRYTCSTPLVRINIIFQMVTKPKNVVRIFFISSKTRLITRNDLTIDWKLLYVWAKLVLFNHDESYSLVAMPKLVFSLL